MDLIGKQVLVQTEIDAYIGYIERFDSKYNMYFIVFPTGEYRDGLFDESDFEVIN